MLFRFRATLSDSKFFFRIYDIDGSISLFALHNFLLNDMDFSPDQMTMFEGRPENGPSSRYGLFDLGCGSMDKVHLADVIARGETELRYYFNLRYGRYLILKLEVEDVPVIPRVSYPLRVDEKGDNPDQFAAKYDDRLLQEAEAARRAPAARSVADDDEDFDDEDLDDEDADDEEDDEELIVDESEI